MPSGIKFFLFPMGIVCVVNTMLLSQEKSDDIRNEQPSTIVVFRTFDIFNFGRSYKLYANDSLAGRIKTRGVIVINTYAGGMSFHAQTKAPSLNADKRTNFRKIKRIKYPFALKPGQVYFVKCGYLNQNIFDMPRQPTIRLLKGGEIGKYLRRGFLRRKIKRYLFEEWLNEKDIKKFTTN